MLLYVRKTAVNQILIQPVFDLRFSFSRHIKFLTEIRIMKRRKDRKKKSDYKMYAEKKNQTGKKITDINCS